MNIKFRRRHIAVVLAALVVVSQFAFSDQSDATADVFSSSSPTSYAEIWVPHTSSAGFNGGCVAASPVQRWYIEPEPACDTTLTFTLPDPASATTAELYFDIWAGRSAHRVRYSLNGDPVVTVNAGYDNSRTPVVLVVDVADLQNGSNTITFSSISNKYHIHDVAVRLYGITGSYPETGGITSIGGIPQPGVGGVLDVTGGETVTINATVPGADMVEFIAYYDGFDEDNDGNTRGWHAFTRLNYNPGGDSKLGKDPNGDNYVKPATGGTIGHIGTVLNNDADDTYTIIWDTSLIASQTGVKVKVRAISEGSGTRLDVADAVGGASADFEISRSTYLVELFRDTDFTDTLIHVEGAPDSVNRVINLPSDISDWITADHLGLYWQNPHVQWNGGETHTAFVNDDDVWDVSAVRIDIVDLQVNSNTITYSYNLNTSSGNNRTGTLFGQHVEEPGAMLVVKRAGAVRIYEPPESRSAIDGQLVTLDVAASGLGPLSYEWTVDNVTIAGETGPSYTFTASDSLPSADYRVVVTNAGGGLTSQPATVTVLAEAFTTDDFSNPAASAALWDQVDSFGVFGPFVYTGSQAILSVPEDASSNQPWTLGNRAPTLRQAMSDTDFDLVVAFDSTPSERYQIQGVVVAGPGEFLRFDVNHDGTESYAFAARISGGASTVYVSSVPIPDAHSAYLRVRRVGDMFTMFTSNDGTSWVERGSFTEAMTVTEFGPFGGNAIPANNGTAPIFHAVVDYVRDPTDLSPQVESDSTAPTISGIDVIEGPTSLVVRWTTDEPTTGSVDYVLGGLPESRSSGLLGYNHEVLVLGLDPLTTYALDLNADDINGNSSLTSTSGTTTALGAGSTLFDVWYGDTQDFGAPGSPQALGERPWTGK